MATIFYVLGIDPEIQFVDTSGRQSTSYSDEIDADRVSEMVHLLTQIVTTTWQALT